MSKQLIVEYIPFKEHTFPRSWKNRPFQFNVPFSVVLFTDTFVEKYTTFLQDKGQPNKIELEPFVIDYISSWMKERGPGHYKLINEVMFCLFSHSITDLSEKSKAQIVETQITMKFFINYIVEVLVNFTKPGVSVKDCLRNYLDNVFIKIVDIWGLISVYFVFIEILFDNYSRLTTQQMNILKKIKYIFVEYLYSPRYEPINLNSLYLDLDELSKLFYSNVNNNNKNNARGINKTKKNSLIKSNISFKKKPKKKRFTNPFILSLK